MRRIIDELVRATIVREDGLVPTPRFTFRHGLYQEAVLATLTPARSQELSRLVAESLVHRLGAEHNLEQVASYYVASDEPSKALDYLERASRRAASLSSLTEAIDLADEAVAVATRLHDDEATLRIELFAARLAREMGDHRRAFRRLRRLLNRTKAESERAAIVLEIARTEFELGKGESATAACEEGLRLEADRLTRAELLLLNAAIVYRRNDLAAAKSILVDVDVDWDALPTEIDARRRSLWAATQAAAGDGIEAERTAEAALTIAQQDGSASLVLRAKRDLGIIRFINGRLPSADSVLEDVYQSALEGGHTIRAQEAVANLVEVQLHRGKLESARRIGTEALKWIQGPYWRAALLEGLGEVEHELGLAEGVERPR
jgi:tetratricopeptide (TPR) repeat protein